MPTRQGGGAFGLTGQREPLDLAAYYYPAFPVNSDDMKNVLAKIDTNR